MKDVNDTKHSPQFSVLLQQLLAYSSILGALSYLFGRVYYQGYFDALGIDMSFVQLSVTDYLEMGWIFLWVTGFFWEIIIQYILFALIIYALFAPMLDEWVVSHKKLFFSILLIAWATFVIYVNIVWILAFLRNMFLIKLGVFLGLVVLGIVFRKSIIRLLAAWKDKLLSNSKYLERIDKLIRVSDTMVLQAGLLLIFLATFYYIGLKADEFGNALGRTYLNEKAKEVELISSVPIMSSAVSTTNNVYVQDDLRLLLFNDGHYFMSKLDGKCKPQEVFVVDQSNVVSIKMTQPLPSQICSKP